MRSSPKYVGRVLNVSRRCITILGCVVQFADEEEELQQIRGLGTDIAIVRFLLLTLTILPV